MGREGVLLESGGGVADGSVIFDSDLYGKGNCKMWGEQNERRAGKRGTVHY